MGPLIVRIVFYLGAVSCAFAQLDSNSVTVSASRNTSAPADQAVFAISVDTDFSVGLSDVLAAVQAAGLTISNFIGVSSPQGGFIVGLPTGPGPQPFPQPRLQWVFAVPIPISKTKDMASALTDLQQSIAQSHSGMQLTFSLQGTQVSPQAQQSQACVVADLLADARAQAQKLAGAAGLTVGSVLAMSGSTANTSTASGVYIGIPLGLGFSSSSFGSPLAPACFIAVKFALK